MAAALREQGLTAFCWTGGYDVPAALGDLALELAGAPAGVAGVHPQGLAVAPQFICYIGKTHEDAVQRFRHSQMYEHLVSLRQSTLKEQAGVNLEQVNPSLLLKYSETATLDPYGVSGTASMALLHELMARASILGPASLSPSGMR